MSVCPWLNDVSQTVGHSLYTTQTDHIIRLMRNVFIRSYVVGWFHQLRVNLSRQNLSAGKLLLLYQIFEVQVINGAQRSHRSDYFAHCHSLLFAQGRRLCVLLLIHDIFFLLIPQANFFFCYQRRRIGLHFLHDILRIHCAFLPRLTPLDTQFELGPSRRRKQERPISAVYC